MVQAYLKLSADEQAAWLLKVYFAEEWLADVPARQLKEVIRPIRLHIDGDTFTLTRRTRK